MRQPNRRTFLKTLALGAAGAARGPRWVRAAEASGASPSGPLKGFIIADAHFGWGDPRQPSPETQRQLLRRILSRFPDLDVFIDTGDAHHSGLTSAQPLEEWTEIVLEGCGPIPFLYVPGNHEITTQKDDAEWRCETMGSLACRPYYAVDLKNIHLVAFPELIRTTLLTKEEMEWLRLDLEVNKDKSILLFSHNNIRGTTSDGGEDGYRGLVNSREILELLMERPNVLAWMHGHNHMYQIVEQSGKLFVSNGRFGGFDLAKQGRPGQPLGGIYFEIDGAGLTVRCYNAEDDKFLDELRGPDFSRTLRARTSFDVSQPPRVAYGRGGAPDGERIPVRRHWGGGHGPRELFLTGAADPLLNDDPEFRLYMTRNAGKPTEDKQLSAAGAAPNNAWEWANPGVRLRARDGKAEVTTVSLPRSGAARFLYYRCPPGVRLLVEATVESPSGGQTVKPRCFVHDRAGQQRAALEGAEWTLAAGARTHRAEFELPPLTGADTIYGDPRSDNVLHVSFSLEFRGLNEDIVLRRFAVQRAGAEGATRDAAVLEDGARY
ncbi:MAG: metallophosphoesterase, partial [Candidatus Sumerlaeota bacterium]|nr:metallophosphoesterase [Candidatus Sumerlaeota bacterium]